MLDRKELKTRAKEKLGNGIFTTPWLWALLVLVIVGVISGVAGSVIPGIGALVVMGPLTIGALFYFLKQARGEKTEIMDMFSGFTKDFGGNFVLSLLVEIFTMLWSLLFVVPGIIKSYSYSMAYYIKLDNEGIGWKEAISQSRKMMKGHKWELFVLDLSFIGWYFVGSLCLGVGALWVAPYHYATRTEFYEELRKLPVVE